MSNIKQQKYHKFSINLQTPAKRTASQPQTRHLRLGFAAFYFACLLFLAGTLTACGQKSDANDSALAENGTAETPENNSGNGQSMEALGTENGQENIPSSPANASSADASHTEDSPDESSHGTSSSAESTAESIPTENDASKTAELNEIKNKFGENCIADQTFEVELSEYEGKVYFVPFAPSQVNPEFHIQLIKDGKTLAELPQYIPDSMAGETFSSLDAVSFLDMNYDGNTDILLIETYGNTSFAAVYYGYGESSEDYEKSFFPRETLSENITRQVQPLTVSEIRNFLSAGKKNGNFSNYQEAYRAVSKWCTMDDGNAPELTYDLIYFDDDEIPELVIGINGYYMSLYTFYEGTVYCLMDNWGYGAMGNAGYEYAPRENNLRNYNSDYAGALVYTTYMALGSRHSLEITAQIETFNFDDVNGNGMLDEEEYDSVGNYGVSYLNGAEITDEEWDAFEAGEYEFIEGSMTLEELMEELG